MRDIRTPKAHVLYGPRRWYASKEASEPVALCPICVMKQSRPLARVKVSSLGFPACANHIADLTARLERG